MSKIRDEASKVSQSLVGKNRIINGGMTVWQRGNSITSPAGTLYFGADRMGFLTTTVGATASLFDGTANPDMAVTGQRTAMKLVSSGTPGVALITQRIEGANCNDFVGRKVTFSAWVFSSVALSGLNWLLNTPNAQDNFGGGATTLASGNFSAIPIQTWTKITFTFTGTAACQKGVGVEIRGMDLSASREFYTTGWQLELGEVPTQFEYKLYGDTLRDCQRYFCTSYPPGTNPGAANAINWVIAAVCPVAGIGEFCAESYKVTMRVSPTVTFYSPTTGASGMVRNFSTSADVAASIVQNGANGFRGIISNPVASNLYWAHYTAQAELL